MYVRDQLYNHLRTWMGVVEQLSLLDNLQNPTFHLLFGKILLAELFTLIFVIFLCRIHEKLLDKVMNETQNTTSQVFSF